MFQRVQHVAMIRREPDNGVVFNTVLFEALEESADLGIQAPDLGIVLRESLPGCALIFLGHVGFDLDVRVVFIFRAVKEVLYAAPRCLEALKGGFV